MRRTALGVSTAVLVFACLQASSADADVLITREEAGLPGKPAIGMTTRGLTRGPGIEVMSPAKDSKGVTSPLPLKIKFHARNNVAIDPGSIKLIYLKSKPVDLTDRIKKHLTSDGIVMDKAEVPPGTHTLRLDVKDARGRAATALIKLTVTGN